eukprot:606425_1
MATRDVHVDANEILSDTNDFASGSLKTHVSIVRRDKSPPNHDEKRCCSDCLAFQIPIFLPFGPLLCYWNSFLLLMLFYSIVEIPYSIAFEIVPLSTDLSAIIGLIIDICLLFDIILNFRTAYIDQYDRLRIIHDPKLIAKRYITRWFLIDLVSSLPLLFIIISSNSTSDSMHSAAITVQFIRLLRVIKFLRIIQYIFHEVTHSMYHLNREQKTLLQLMKIIGSMLLIAHFFSCIWYSIGNYAYKHNHPSWIDTIIEYHDFNEGNFTKYSYSFYWAIVTLFTTGYGDIHANNIYEQWFASVGIIFGSCLFAYFIGVLTNGLNEDLNHRNASETVEKSLVFCSHYNLPRELRTAVVTHIKYFNDYNYAFDNNYIMNSLPNYLQKEIEKHLKRSRLRDLDIFKSLPDEITGQIALKLRSKSCGIGKILYNKGDIGKEVFIQRTGKSELINDDGTIRECQRGDVIGEDAILSTQRVNTVRCLTWSEFYVLHTNDILDVLNDNYDAIQTKQKWLSIQNIIRMPGSGSQQTLTDANCRHFVKFNTVKDFEEYVPMEAREVPVPNVISAHTQKTAQHEEYERKLEIENEAEETQCKQKQKHEHKSMNYILNMFGNAIERENSHIRNVKVVENHNKSQRGLAYGVSSDNTENHTTHHSFKQSNSYIEGEESHILLQCLDEDDEISDEIDETNDEAMPMNEINDTVRDHKTEATLTRSIPNVATITESEVVSALPALSDLNVES